jgi:DNA-binding GntR family transcriptional regulator
MSAAGDSQPQPGLDLPDGPVPGFTRFNLREQIKDVILDGIISGSRPPGSRLVETQIARELGVSQTSVREALRDLEQIGCVAHQPFRGCSVRAFSAPELLEAFPVRIALEALAARLAAERIAADELERLRRLLDSMRRAARERNPHEQSLSNAAFHATIVHAARNSTLERQWQLLEPFSRTYITVSRPSLDLVELSERHVPILQAMERRDPAGAARAMEEHLAHAAELLREHVDGLADASQAAARPSAERGSATGGPAANSGGAMAR